MKVSENVLTSLVMLRKCVQKLKKLYTISVKDPL